MLPFCPNDFDDNGIHQIAARGGRMSRQLARVHTLRAQDKDRQRYDSKHQWAPTLPESHAWVYCSSEKSRSLRKTLKKISDRISQMNSLAASVKLTYSASMVDRLTDFCLKVRYEIGVSSIKVMNPPIDTRSFLFVAKSESE
ncbi:hypothetical protein TNCV_3680151 [Trichonephila clavipes]|nr:hypothetical protein TNCV_3680151 [Trichonephila clavipes]